MYKLPGLPYEYDALEPYIDAETMKLHHDKHHQAYLDNLNKAIADSDYQPEDPQELLKNPDKLKKEIVQAVINNGGGHVNHTFFWNIMSAAEEDRQPRGELKKAIENKFSSLDVFKDEFTSRAMALFGSGWTFLVVTQDKKLELTRQSFQNSPLTQGNIPIIGIDLWEHAYYLKYQNRKAEYIAAWWNVVNWRQAEDNFLSAK